MRTTRLLFDLITLSLLILTAPGFMNAQNESDKYLLHGIYLRGGRVSFNKALVMFDERTEIWVDQAKTTFSYGLGYDYLERDFWAGFGVGAHYCTTSLNSFSYQQGSYSYNFKDVDYSLLLFDGDIYLVPFTKFPLAFTFGFTLDGSFHGYTLSANDPAPGTNGKKGFSIFRYGYIMGCKLVPFDFLSLELEYRPMGAYSSTTSYELGSFAYNKDGTNYYWATKTGSSEGNSETMFLMSLSVHF